MKNQIEVSGMKVTARLGLEKRQRTCPGCSFKGNVYNFSPSIEIEKGDFRIFHFYAKMKGPLFCNQCKREHLLEIAHLKNLSENQISFLKERIFKRREFYSFNNI